MKKVQYSLIAIMVIFTISLFAPSSCYAGKRRACRKTQELIKKRRAEYEAKKLAKLNPSLVVSDTIKAEVKTKKIKLSRHKSARTIQADRPNYARKTTIRCEGGVCGGRADRQRYMGRIASTNRW